MAVLRHRLDERARAERLRLEGRTAPRRRSSRSSSSPRHGQATWSTSSIESWPTSPIQRSPFARSNEKRHGFRTPTATITGFAPGRAGSRRRILPSSELGFWARVLGVAARAAVAHPDVEEPVLAVGDHAAVVVRVRLVDEEQLRRARRQRLRAVRAVANDARVAVAVGVVDDELPARRVVGREREPEQALLAAGRRSASGRRGTAAAAPFRP